MEETNGEESKTDITKMEEKEKISTGNFSPLAIR